MKGQYKITDLSDGSLFDKIDGTVRGTSYGVSWSQPIGDNFQASLGYKVKQYKFDDTDQNSNTGEDLSTDFDTTIVTIGIVAQF